MATPPRVLHVLRGDHSEHVGGDLVQLAATVEGLRAAGIDAISATIDAAPDDVDVVHVYNLQRPAALHHDVRAAARRWPDAPLVVSPVWWPWRLRTMAASGDRAVAVRAAKQGLKQTLWWPAVRRVLTTAALVAPNSHAEVAALRHHYRLGRDRGPDRWAVVPNGIHLERWRYGRAPADDRAQRLTALGLDPAAAPVVACVARVEPVKNQLAIVRALDALPGAALVLVGPDGDAAYADEVRATAAARAPGRVALPGRMEAGELAALLGAVDVHVLASYRETPGLATLEAAATGCAVVVTADGSATEYLGDAAYVADPTDPASIAAQIAAAAADPRQPAARAAVERYDWSVAVDALVDGYARLPGWPLTTGS